MGMSEVEAFLAEHGIDDSASNDLRGCPPEVQRLVLDRGTLADVTNPSRALIGRIKNARAQTGVKTQLCRHFQRNGFCQLGSSCGFAHGEHELGSAPLPTQSPQIIGQAMTQMFGQANPRQPRQQPQGQQQGGIEDLGLATAVEQFIAENGIDVSAANDLRGCPPEVLRCVLEKGTLMGCRNPNAALIMRIKKAREECMP